MTGAKLQLDAALKFLAGIVEEFVSGWCDVGDSLYSACVESSSSVVACVPASAFASVGSRRAHLVHIVSRWLRAGRQRLRIARTAADLLLVASRASCGSAIVYSSSQFGLRWETASNIFFAAQAHAFFVIGLRLACSQSNLRGSYMRRLGVRQRIVVQAEGLSSLPHHTLCFAWQAGRRPLSVRCVPRRSSQSHSCCGSRGGSAALGAAAGSFHGAGIEIEAPVRGASQSVAKGTIGDGRTETRARSFFLDSRRVQSESHMSAE